MAGRGAAAEDWMAPECTLSERNGSKGERRHGMQRNGAHRTGLAAEDRSGSERND